MIYITVSAVTTALPWVPFEPNPGRSRWKGRVMDKITNEDVAEQVHADELTENELAHISGGNIDDGPWCGTKPPGWHPPILGPHKVS